MIGILFWVSRFVAKYSGLHDRDFAALDDDRFGFHELVAHEEFHARRIVGPGLEHFDRDAVCDDRVCRHEDGVLRFFVPADGHAEIFCGIPCPFFRHGDPAVFEIVCVGREAVLLERGGELFFRRFVALHEEPGDGRVVARGPAGQALYRTLRDRGHEERAFREEAELFELGVGPGDCSLALFRETTVAILCPARRLFRMAVAHDDERSPRIDAVQEPSLESGKIGLSILS